MKAAIVNPYWDSLGGGERYCIGVIKAFENKGYAVTLQWPDPAITSHLEKRFGIKLASVKVASDVNRGDGYDACFWVSDGSIPTLKSRNNILHFQVPFSDVGGRTLINKMKFMRVKNIVANSEFTKRVVDREYGIKSKVVYPPVSVSMFHPKKKENCICYIGRFSKLVQHKRQDILIEVFKKFYKTHKNWKLILAGGAEVGNDVTASLRDLAKGYPIEIIESPSFNEVRDIVGKSKIFWSAAGYGVDETRDPSGVEHFGITLIEAMAAKAVPVVVGKGGFTEIIEKDVTGFLWIRKQELVDYSDLVATDYKLYRQMSSAAKTRSADFSEKVFEDSFGSLIN